MTVVRIVLSLSFSIDKSAASAMLKALLSKFSYSNVKVGDSLP
jgi:hypothetical protein